MAQLAENRYGKSRVRLVRLNRQAAIHEFEEWSVEILLRGDFLSCFAEGDNSKILPTDTMKNTVYSLARKSSATCIEEFSEELIDHFLTHNPQVSAAEVTVQEKAWQHLNVAGKPHPTTFSQTGSEVQITRVDQKRGENIQIESGLSDLVLVKTAGSAFEGYVHDPLTTLPETSDRLFGTSLRATWKFFSRTLPFPSLRKSIRESLVATFATHQSKSVQHTLYAMAECALATAPQISEITLTMPNKHCLLVDLSRFGQDNPNRIFVPIDEPHGTIEARVCREN
ncbi:MAG TPA: urate oxidase [Candidatus Saccharimonadales bacterium]|nr:urate oxidase [Candidatus Saccharimonadales bacterium]